MVLRCHHPENSGDDFREGGKASFGPQIHFRLGGQAERFQTLRGKPLGVSLEYRIEKSPHIRRRPRGIKIARPGLAAGERCGHLQRPARVGFVEGLLFFICGGQSDQSTAGPPCCIRVLLSCKEAT